MSSLYDTHTSVIRSLVLRVGIAELPVGKVYHMPGASDNYVVAFRNWLRESAGGGPFGPQNGTWLQVCC